MPFNLLPFPFRTLFFLSTHLFSRYFLTKYNYIGFSIGKHNWIQPRKAKNPVDITFKFLIEKRREKVKKKKGKKLIHAESKIKKSRIGNKHNFLSLLWKWSLIRFGIHLSLYNLQQPSISLYIFTTTHLQQWKDVIALNAMLSHESEYAFSICNTYNMIRVFCFNHHLHLTKSVILVSFRQNYLEISSKVFRFKHVALFLTPFFRFRTISDSLNILLRIF